MRSVLTIADFYSARQWRSTGMYCDIYRPLDIAHELQLCLPDPAGRAAGPGRTIRMFFFRQSGPEFSERDRALLVLLRPHLQQAYLEAERRRHPMPWLTPRQNDLLRLLAAGHTNTQIARRLGISESNRAHPPGTHLRQAGRLQPHRRRHPRLPLPGGIAPQRAARSAGHLLQIREIRG